ncbi:MAG: tripartite tricarboxylate transporter permease [Candidatus Micrarchaeota archaeon]
MEFLAGALLGMLGVLPFVHTNLILQVAKPFLAQGAGLVAFASALSFSHLVFETLPALFLFIPTENLSASVLPFQRMALQGRGAEALNRIIAATLLALCVAAAVLPLQAAALPAIKEAVGENLKWALLAVLALYFTSMRKWKERLGSLAVFLLSGALGVTAFAAPWVREPLFPLLTGLFAVPAILLARGSAVKDGGAAGETRLDVRLVLAGVAVGSVSSLLPGLTVAVLLCICLLAVKEDYGAFMSLAPSIAASKTLYDLASPFTVGNARSMAGAIIAGAPGPEAQTLAIASASALASAALASAVLLATYRKILAKTGGDYSGFKKWLLAVLALIALGLNGWQGILLMTTAALVGALPLLLGLRRSAAVGALVVPALAYHFGMA